MSHPRPHPCRSLLSRRCLVLAAAVLATLLATVTVNAPRAVAATAVTTAWQNGAFHLDADGVVSRSDLVLGQPNVNPTASMPLGNGALGVAAWAANGFTAQLNRSDTMPDRKSPGQLTIPGLTALTHAGDFSGHLDLTDGVLHESGAGMTLTAWVSSSKDELIVDVTGADPKVPQTASINLWSGRNPVAAVAGPIGTLAETWVDNTEAGKSGRSFGSLAAITAGAQGVTTSVVNSTQVQTSFTPNADGSFRVVVASPAWTGGDAAATAGTLIGDDATATETSLLAGQNGWWHTFWSHSGLIEMNSTDGSAAYIENLRTLYLYEEAASMKKGSYPGSQAGGADMFAWNKDAQAWTPSEYWLWNLRTQISANMTSGNYSLNTPIFDMYSDDLANIEAWTHQQMGGLPGACVPEVMRFNGNGGDPGAGANSGCSEPGSPNWNALDISSGPEVSMYMWQQYLATGDQAMLAKYFPFMKATAQFLLAYQQVGSDGLLHAVANAHETQWAVQDPTTDIAADQTLFPIITQAAHVLGTDTGDDAAFVQQLTTAEGQIPPYPRTDAATRSQLLNPDYSQAETDSADATGTDMVAISYQPAAARKNGENIELEPLWPWDNVSDQDSNLFTLEQRSYASRPNKGGNDWSMDAIDAARLQNPSQVESNLLSITEAHQVYPNGFADLGSSVGYQPYIEQEAGAATAVNEALAQDYDGILRFAPAWPSDWDGSGSVYVQHNTKVDVQVVGGQLSTAAIEAGSTETMKVKNPWPGQQVQVVDGSSPSTVVVPSTNADIFEVPVTAGNSYLVEPITNPTTGLPFAQVTGTANTAARHLKGVQLGLDVPSAESTAVVGSVLAASNGSYGLTEDETPSPGFDGPTTPSIVSGLTARTTTNSNMYFDIDDTIAHTGDYGAAFTISYFDKGTGTISVQYDDGSTDPYHNAGTFTLTNSNTWKTATVTTTGAYFGGGEHSNADFRLRNNNGPTLIVHSIAVSVTGPAVPAKIDFPPAPVIVTPKANATVRTDSAISGTTEDDGAITVSEGPTTLCTTTASDTGMWSCTPSDGLTEGKHSITATVGDPTGLTSTASAVDTFHVSDAPPGTAVVGSVVGATNASYGMTEDEVASGGFDGPTTASTIDGLSARTTTNSNMYFDIDDSIALAGDYAATFTVGYYDAGNGSFSVQYDDGSTNPYRSTSSIPLTNSNTWKKATVSATDAYFGGAQHSKADFRLRNGSGQVVVHSVAVTITGPGVPTTTRFAPAPVITAPADGAPTPAEPTIRGTAEPESRVTVSDGNDSVCTASAADDGTWSCTPTSPLSDGPHSLTADASDLTASDAPASTAVSVTVISGGLTAGTPAVSGDAIVGSTLAVDPGMWSPDGVSLAYQWLRDGTPISGATSTAYTVVADDLQHALSVAVTGSLAEFTDVTATSRPTVPVVAGTLTVGTPTISGKPTVGNTLTATAGTWTSDAQLAYQWLRNGKPISGATGTTYQAVSTDLGHRLSLRVTGTLAGYSTATATSASTTPVVPGRPASGHPRGHHQISPR